jgi:hypothetical protein
MEQLNRSNAMLWALVGYVVAWLGLPVLVLLMGAWSIPARRALQDTPRLYVTAGILAAVWGLLGLPLAIMARLRWEPKIAAGLAGWAVLAGLLMSGPLLEMLNSHGAQAPSEATLFSHQGGFRRKVHLLAVDGPAKGQTFTVVLSDIEGRQAGKGTYAGRVRRGRLGLWWASFDD